MVALRLKPELESRLERMAKKKGQTKSSFAREAIEEHIAEMELMYRALHRKKNLERPTRQQRQNVPWVYRLDDRALKELSRLDRSVQDQILRYCQKRLVGNINPRGFGHALTGQFRGLWRYRVGDYRLICEIKDREVVVLVIAVGHRSEIYR